MTFYIFSVTEQVTGIKLNPRKRFFKLLLCSNQITEHERRGKAQLRKTYVSRITCIRYVHSQNIKYIQMFSIRRGNSNLNFKSKRLCYLVSILCNAFVCVF